MHAERRPVRSKVVWTAIYARARYDSVFAGACYRLTEAQRRFRAFVAAISIFVYLVFAGCPCTLCDVWMCMRVALGFR